jgi:deoxycytidylate deaminase
VLTLNSCPCLTCSVKIVQVGITEVVFSQSYHMDTQSAKIFQEAGVHLRQYAPVCILMMRKVLALTIGSHEKVLSIFVTLVLETLAKHEERLDQKMLITCRLNHTVQITTPPEYKDAVSGTDHYSVTDRGPF